jgi:hypothetical protein
MISQKLNEHPNHYISNFEGSELFEYLQTWARQELISWLKWNDPNGIYDDEASSREFDNILSKEEAIEIIMRQISEGK